MALGSSGGFLLDFPGMLLMPLTASCPPHKSVSSYFPPWILGLGWNLLPKETISEWKNCSMEPKSESTVPPCPLQNTYECHASSPMSVFNSGEIMCTILMLLRERRMWSQSSFWGSVSLCLEFSAPFILFVWLSCCFILDGVSRVPVAKDDCWLSLPESWDLQRGITIPRWCDPEAHTQGLVHARPALC